MWHHSGHSSGRTSEQTFYDVATFHVDGFGIPRTTKGQYTIANSLEEIGKKDLVPKKKKKKKELEDLMHGKLLEQLSSYTDSKVIVFQTTAS